MSEGGIPTEKLSHDGEILQERLTAFAKASTEKRERDLPKLVGLINNFAREDILEELTDPVKNRALKKDYRIPFRSAIRATLQSPLKVESKK